VKIVSSAALPVVEGDLPKALLGFVSVLRDHCAFDVQTRCALSFIMTAGKFPALVARALPPESGEFETYSPSERKMTSAQFLMRIAANARLRQCSCDVTLTDFLARDQVLDLLSELAGALPVSGRGASLMLFVDSAILFDASEPVRGRLSLQRFPRGKRHCGAGVLCEFCADSKSGPVAKKVLRELREAFGVEWKKPCEVFDPDRADRPSASEASVIERCIEEAFARAAADLDRAQAALTGIPLLYSSMSAFGKRVRDVQSGIREPVDFVRELRQLIQTNFPDYASCSKQRSAPTFRKRLADHIEGLLFVERLYEQGLGKCFTLQYQVDFPGTRFAGENVNVSSRSRSLFSLFHKGWMPPKWAYSTSEELAEVLGGCRDVLRMALPALETRLKELLSPIPGALPPDMQMRGRLTAREACEQALFIAKKWAPDARFAGLHSGGLHVLTYEVAPGVDLDGRLQPQGSWLVRFESKRLYSDVLIEVPHTGLVRWNSMRKLGPMLCAPPREEWMDSPCAMQKGVEAIQALAPNHEWATWECGLEEERAVAATVWTIHASFRSAPGHPGLRDAHVYLDPADGTVVHSAVYER
jgi:hypothetical protein